MLVGMLCDLCCANGVLCAARGRRIGDACCGLDVGAGGGDGEGLGDGDGGGGDGGLGDDGDDEGGLDGIAGADELVSESLSSPPAPA
jgi:hypothetical protein